MEEEVRTAGNYGPLFCEWCIDNWSRYTARGGPCKVLAIVPIALRHDGPVEVGAEMPISLCNLMGSVHGGASSMLLDEVGGLATCCRVGLRYLRGTRRLDVTFLKPITPGPVIARATVIGFDNSTVTVSSEVLQAGQPVARASAKYAVHPLGSVKVPRRG